MSNIQPVADRLWHPWAPMGSPADRPKFVRGSGSHVVDDAGRWFLDASSAALNTNCGHGSVRLADVAADQLRRIAHYDLSVASHGPAEDLAVRMAGLLPGDDDWYTSFVNSGSEATELALQIAVDHAVNHGHDRRQIVSLADSYHGTTLLAKSLTDLRGNSSTAATELPIRHVPLPTDPRTLRSAPPEQLLAGFESHLRAAPTAAVIVEPLLNVGGGVVLPDGFLTGLRALCDRYDSLLIVDEVFCGFGRTGRMFGSDHESVVPDIVTYSKGLSSGYVPIAGVSCRSSVYCGYTREEGIGVLRYGHTTGGHAVACRVALEVLDILEEDDLCGNAARRGAELLARLEQLRTDPGVSDVRGLGLVVTVELVDDVVASEVLSNARSAGVLLRQQGRHIMAIPPLVIDEAGVAEIVDATVGAVSGLHV